MTLANTAMGRGFVTRIGAVSPLELVECPGCQARHGGRLRPPCVLKGIPVRLLACFHAPFKRERDRIRAEMQHIQGLLPLLMKERNGSRWSPDERAQLRDHLRNLR